MKTLIKFVICLLAVDSFLALATPSQAHAQAKRTAPPEVKPVVANGIEYAAPHYAQFNKAMRHNGGYVAAIDLKTKKLLWLKEVYPIEYDKALERDAQEVFIRSLRLKGKILIVTDEYRRVFKVPIDGSAKK